MNKKELVYYLENRVTDKELFLMADECRRKYVSDRVILRGIIEFSNYCVHNCLYCGLRRDNKRISRYRMSPSEIVRLAGIIKNSGVNTVVLQSGDDLAYSRDALCGIIRRIMKEVGAIAITLSVGERPLNDYRAFKDAGASRYLLKHETINPALYKKMRPGNNLKKRIKILEYLKKTGYEVGSGNIVGLPGQTFEDLAQDILFLKNLKVDMAGIGPFIPQKNTPLAGNCSPDVKTALKVIALVRLAIKKINLPATTALATLDPGKGQVRGLKAGANVLMPDFTPLPYREKYTIYDCKRYVSLKTALSTAHQART